MSTWTVDHHDGVALLRFVRPPANFMDFSSCIDLADHLEGLADKASVARLIMLTGGVDGMFINHAELSDLARASEGRTTSQETGSWSRAIHLLEEIPQPTVAAIDGLASGGGNEIALACTLRVGSERARLQQPEVPAGIVPGGGGSVRLPRLVGPGVAADAILTGRAFGAVEACRTGWISAVLPTEGFIDHALDWARAIAASPASSLNAAKQLIVRGSRLRFDEALALEQERFRELSAERLSDTTRM